MLNEQELVSVVCGFAVNGDDAERLFDNGLESEFGRGCSVGWHGRE
jgi:hypothetical protein